MGTNVNECKCPSCRHNRGEISDEAYAWYLKGAIEHTANFIRLVKSAPNLDALKKKVGLNQYDVDCSVEELDSMVRDEKVPKDPALIHPYHYVIPENCLNDGQDHVDYSDPIVLDSKVWDGCTDR